MRYLILVLAWAHLSAAQNVDEILQRSFAAGKANGEKARQYAYVQEETHFEYDKAGVAQKTGAETYDVIFVEGEEYKKLVARDGQPLNAKDQAKEEKKLQDVAKERREQHRSGLFSHTLSLSGADEQSTIFFERHLLGEEEINGRKAWVVELTPRTDHKPADAHEKDALSSSRKIWLDQAESVTLRWEAVVVADNVAMKPGTKFTIDFAKINEDAWLATFFVADFRVQAMKVFKGSGRVETKSSNFRKFDVQSTITVDEAR